jgi:hypothetical protein
MLIDCDACAVRGPACGDCVVSVLLSGPATSGHHAGHAGHGAHGAPDTHRAPDAPGTADAVPATAAELDAAERAAIAVLAGCGLVPPLRLVPVEPVRRPPGAARDPIAESEREVS